MKRLKILVLCSFVIIQASAQKPALTLDKCFEMALEHNQKIKMAQHQLGAATELSKAGKTLYLPKFSVNGSYTHMGSNYLYDLTIPETTLPVGELDANGKWTLPVSMWANQWATLPNGVTAPLDASGNPFDPTTNPEKVIPKEWAYIPETKFSLETDFNDIIAANAGVVQPIYTGGKIKETNNILKHTQEIAGAKVDLQESDIIYDTEQAYWRTVAVSEKVKLAQQAGKMIDALVTRLENLHAEGIVTQNDVLKAKVKQNEIKLNIQQAENGFKLSQMALCQLIGMPLYSQFSISDTTIHVEKVTISDSTQVEGAISKRPEIEILEETVGIAKSTVGLMKSRYLPNIVATANYLVTNPNPYNSFANEFGGDWNAGVIVNVPIFHFGDKKHTLEAARHEEEASKLKLEEAREMIALQIQQLSYKGSESVIKVELAEKTVEQASQNLSMSQANFSEGTITPSDLLEAQTLWQKAMSDYIEAKTDYKTNLSELKKALGELNKENFKNTK
ncbi:MAG TPA: TolC family protein [Prolixibacteraceae bacterium]|nr:TolC family protein [Prolixibacteraceae bacterium]HPS11891.1 TolC family protein [Prolixibacteraceae bacterium]